MSNLVTMLVGLWAATAPPDAQPARPATFTLQWSAPAGCPDETVVRKQIEQQLPEAVDAQGVLEVEAQVESTAEGFALRLRTSYGGNSTLRELTSAQCTSVAEAVTTVVVISMSTPAAGLEPEGEPEFEPAPLVVDPTGSESFVVDLNTVPDDSPPPPTPAKQKELTTRHRSSATVRPRRAPLARPQWVLGVAVGPEYGALSTITAAVQIRAGLQWSRASAEVHGLYLARRRDTGALGGAVQLFAGGARGCGWPLRRAVELGLCAGLEAGGLTYATQDAGVRRTTSGPWLAPLVSSPVRWRGTRVGASFAAELAIRAIGTRVLSGGTTAFQSEVWSLRGLLAFEVYLG